jgi:hypothetical protein
MSKDEKYTSIEIDTSELSEAKQLVMLALINEGMLRERERIVGLIPEIVRIAVAYSKEENPDVGNEEIKWLITGENDASEPDAA